MARSKHQVAHAENFAQLRARLGALPPDAYPLLLQQRIDGYGMGVFFLIWKGATAALFAHRRLREKPPSGGVCVYGESIIADPAVVERSRQLLQRFGWQGVAMVEYKVEATSGEPYLMEVNPRFWGSLQLAIDSGVDFPKILAALMLGETPTSPPSYRVGQRTRWSWGDIDHLLARLKDPGGFVAGSEGGSGGTRVRAIADFFGRRKGERNEVFRGSDPRPFLRESMNWLRRR